MLDKLTKHLKNILLIKTIFYVITVFLLFNLIPILREELLESLNKKERVRDYQNQAIIRLDLIADFEDKIIETNNAYNNLIKNAEQNIFQRKIKLLQEFDIISNKYQLSKPITMQITRIPNTSNTKTYNDSIVIREDWLNLDFSSPGTGTFLKISQDIAKILPEGSIIVSSDLKKSEALSSSIADILSENKVPDLYKAKMKIKLREVIYEK